MRKKYFMQVQGLGTALKILFSEKFDLNVDDSPLKKIKGFTQSGFKLKRGEIVSLLNAFGRYVKKKTIERKYVYMKHK